MVVEVCVASIQSIKNAFKAGADRIELCSALGVGGITPSAGLIKEAVHLNLLPIQCLIRPREGHFNYSKDEARIIEQDIISAKKLGCAGVVLGALTNTFLLDIELLKNWKKLAGDMKITFHRAFDVVANPKEALEVLIDLGFDRILTSGQQEKAMVGLSELEMWRKQVDERITIMPGSGINSENCSEFKKAGFKELHLSGSSDLPFLHIPKKVNKEISFLHQPIGESNEEILKKVVRLAKS